VPGPAPPRREIPAPPKQTFAKAFSAGARQRYDGTRCYTPYVLAIARNCLVDWLRRAGRELPAGQDLDLLFDPARDCEGESEFPPELVAAATCYGGVDPRRHKQ
jgi:DNA-directed RNA polymerase specialized sigma24 family protein